MKYSKIILPLALISLGTQLALGMTFKTQIQPLKLPRTLMMSAPTQVPDTVAGDLSVGMMRMCGDGDVVRYSQTYPDFNFVAATQTKLDVITGYWIADADEKSPVPSPTNFYPVAYVKDVSVSESSAGVKFVDAALPINHALSNPVNAFKILSIDMTNIYRNATRSYGAKKSYRLYAGAFTCINMDDAGAVISAKSSDYKYTPSPVEITHVFTHPLGLKAKAEAEALKAGSDKMKMSVSSQPKNDSLYSMEPDESDVRFPYHFKFDEGDISLSGTKAFDLYKKVMAYNHPKLEDAPSSSTAEPKEPASADDKIKYYNDKIVEMKNSFGAIPNTSEQDKISYCKNLGLNVSEEKSPYKWEIFPMNASCKFLHDEAEFSDAYSKLFQTINSITLVPDESKFNGLKKNLAKRLYAANAIEVAQKNLNESSNLKISHANCFNSNSKPIINRVIGSYPFHFSPDPAAPRFTILPNVNNHVHPEPLYAIRNFNQYHASDVHGIWAQVISSGPVYTPGEATEFYVPDYQEAEFDPRDWSILLPVNDKLQLLDRKIESKTFQVPGINILFKIRSVSGSCPGYC